MLTGWLEDVGAHRPVLLVLGLPVAALVDVHDAVCLFVLLFLEPSGLVLRVLLP